MVQRFSYNLPLFCSGSSYQRSQKRKCSNKTDSSTSHTDKDGDGESSDSDRQHSDSSSSPENSDHDINDNTGI